jgi:hypothetical protein
MKMRRPLIVRVALSLLVAMVGGVLGGGTSALAASSVTIAISGTVDGLPESVYLFGLAQITSTYVKSNAKFGHPPRVIVSIDLHDVSGQGLTTGARYVSTGQDELTRRLVASDAVAIMFPFYPNGADEVTSARVGLASFTLNFDLTTGALTGGTATVSTPDF